MNKMKFDIQGTIYTLPINPRSFDSQDNMNYESKRTVDGPSIRYVKYFDTRERIMEWKNLPNSSDFQDMALTLRSIVGLNNIKLNVKDVYLGGNQNTWQDIKVTDFEIQINREKSITAISKLKYDLTLKYIPLRLVEV